MKVNIRKVSGIAIASLGVLALAASGSGFAIADVLDQDPPAEDGDNAAATASVAMKERCIWYVTGAPDGFTLAADDLETSTEYDGTQFDLSVDLATPLLAYTSGNEGGGTADAHSDCTFYGEATGVDVTADFSAAGFTAASTDGDDDLMDFDPTVGLPLTLGVAEGTCRTGGGVSAWTVGPDVVIDDASGVAAQPVLSHGIADTTAVPLSTAGSNDKCDATLSMTVAVPAGKTPLYAGTTYTFTGPTMTTNIDIDTTE